MGNRKSTKYPGVQARESNQKRYRGRPDICYTIDYKDANCKRVRKDVGWASEGFTAAVAFEMRARLINAAKTGTIIGNFSLVSQKNIPTLAEAWEMYKRDWLEANHKHVECDAALFTGVLHKLAPLRLDKITPYTLDQLMADMRNKNYAAQTIRHAVGLIRRIMNRMAKWKIYLGPQPFAEITLPTLNNERQRFLTPEEARALLAELAKRNRRCYLMALVSLHCGLRFGEVANMRWGHIQPETMSIYIPDSKSGHARHSVMTKDVWEALADLPKGAPGDLVFQTASGKPVHNISKAYNKAVDALGLNNGISDNRQKVVFHTLRHTYASWLAKKGQGQLTIADRLGHRSLEMTKRYTHLMDETRKESAEAISDMFHGQTP